MNEHNVVLAVAAYASTAAAEQDFGAVRRATGPRRAPTTSPPPS